MPLVSGESNIAKELEASSKKAATTAAKAAKTAAEYKKTITKNALKDAIAKSKEAASVVKKAEAAVKKLDTAAKKADIAAKKTPNDETNMAKKTADDFFNSSKNELITANENASNAREKLETAKKEYESASAVSKKLIAEESAAAALAKESAADNAAKQAAIDAQQFAAAQNAANMEVASKQAKEATSIKQAAAIKESLENAEKKNKDDAKMIAKENDAAEEKESAETLDNIDKQAKNLYPKEIENEKKNSIRSFKPEIEFSGYISGLFTHYKYNNNTDISSPYETLYVSDLFDYSNIFTNINESILKKYTGWSNEILTDSVKAKYISKFFLNKSILLNYIEDNQKKISDKITDELRNISKEKLYIKYIENKIDSLTRGYQNLIKEKKFTNISNTTNEAKAVKDQKKIIETNFTNNITTIKNRISDEEKNKQTSMKRLEVYTQKILNEKKVIISKNITSITNFIFKSNKKIYINKEPFVIKKINYKDNNINFYSIYGGSNLYKKTINNVDIKNSYITEYIKNNITERRFIYKTMGNPKNTSELTILLENQAQKNLSDDRNDLFRKLKNIKEDTVIKEILKNANTKKIATIEKLNIAIRKSSDENYKKILQSQIDEIKKKEFTKKDDINIEKNDSITIITLKSNDINKIITINVSLYVNSEKTTVSKLNIRASCIDKKNKLKELFNTMVERNVFKKQTNGININTLLHKPENGISGGKKTRKKIFHRKKTRGIQKIKYITTKKNHSRYKKKKYTKHNQKHK